MLRKTLRYLWFCDVVFILFAVLYFAFAFVLAGINVEPETASSEDVIIYLKTNGIHTDLVLPVRTATMDWSAVISFDHTLRKDTAAEFIGIGWGDKGFYLDTATWADLSFSTAFKAVFGLGSSAIHTTYYKSIRESDSCIRIALTSVQYSHLLDFIKKSFARDANGHFMHISTQVHYCDTDAFYESIGMYSLFYTCNTWTNEGLKSCGQRACLWTPFQSGVLGRYKKS